MIAFGVEPTLGSLPSRRAGSRVRLPYVDGCKAIIAGE
jgi:hypothetical protein